MEYQNIVNFLEEKFQKSFVGEVVPGLIHNFANPLNGIMGRSKLLQRKLVEVVKKLEGGKDAYHPEDNKKLVSDVESIAHEADRLSLMLQSVTDKIRAVSDKTIQKINVSYLIEIEMKFFDFYLEFKHSSKKTVSLEKELPMVKGALSDYSLALSALIVHAMDASKESASKEVHISTHFENGHVCIKIQNQGKPISDDQRKYLFELLQEVPSSLDTHRIGELGCAFALLKKWGANIEISREPHGNTVAVYIPPYHEVKAS